MTVAWEAHDIGQLSVQIQAASFTVTAGWQPPVTRATISVSVPRAVESYARVSEPTVTAGSQRDVGVIWRRFPDAKHVIIEAARRSPSGIWQAPARPAGPAFAIPDPFTYQARPTDRDRPIRRSGSLLGGAGMAAPTSWKPRPAPRTSRGSRPSRCPRCRARQNRPPGARIRRSARSPREDCSCSGAATYLSIRCSHRPAKRPKRHSTPSLPVHRTRRRRPHPPRLRSVLS
jgi:hypothetical protein